ncbi:DUF4333 domain-containing protein [Streptomyces sp. NPDC058405]|uniref:DUF4333 domain-containing protein n=1 Tax=Streptomyces sp. NPDC058405 TaxID=3346482 RepID=UPI00365B8E0D
MADQRNFARTVMAFSSIVVAGCAVAVTIKAMSTGIEVKQPRVMDQAALEQQVISDIQGRPEPTDGRLSCPASVVVEVGNKFECRFRDGDNSKFVEVKVVSDQGEVSARFIG